MVHPPPLRSSVQCAHTLLLNTQPPPPPEGGEMGTWARRSAVLRVLEQGAGLRGPVPKGRRDFGAHAPSKGGAGLPPA